MEDIEVIDQNDELLYTTRDATELVAECYTDLSKYVIKTRAYPSVVDGMKAVYRRVVYGSRIYDNRVKSASIVGEAIKIHPHGDSSIYSSLINMTCKYYEFPLFSGKGNWGGLGGDAAAMRYTEACLSELGRLMYLELIDYAEMIEGESGYMEPKYLPALIPYCLLAGSSGLTVGMPTPNIPPLNAMEVLDYWIDRLEGKEPRIPMPDYGEIILNCHREETIEPLIKTGVGKLWFRGLIIQEDENKFVVCTSTPKCYVSDLESKLSWYINEDYVDYNDESDSEGYRHVFVVNTKLISPEKFKNILEKKMKCSVSYRMIFEEDEKAVYCGIDYIYRKNIKYLRECTIRKFTDLSSKIENNLQVLRAIRDFKNAGYVKKLDELSENEVIKIIIDFGYEEWVGKSLLNKPTKYMTRSHDQEIINLEKELEHNLNYKNNPDQYLLTLYYRLKELLTPFYNSRGHSLLRDEIDESVKYYAKLDRENKKIIISDNPDEGVEWTRVVILVSDTGKISKRYVSSRISTEISLEAEGDNWISLLSDQNKYIVLVDGRYIAVKKVSDINEEKCYLKLWEGDKVNMAYGSKSNKIIVTDEKGNYDELNLDNWIKSRISYPSKCMKGQIIGFKEG